ncbi:MAG: alpha/beta fold hydrolase [Desulfuromonadales bacterium]|nr:alpha/beta fold hydrolase [Desulfuromonadales bacterium]
MGTQITENHTFINGHKIAFREQGAGSPVILIHGIPTNSLMWRDIIPKLAKTHRVIAPDLLNYGQSAKPISADVSINAQSHILVKVMDALGAPQADIVAHDIGDRINRFLG